MLCPSASGRDDEIYFHTPAHTAAFPYRVLAAGKATAAPSDPPIRRRFRQHVLILTLAGTGEIEVEGRSYECIKGTIAWLDTSREYRHACARASHGWSYLWFGMRGFGLDETADMLGARARPIIVSTADEALCLQFPRIKNRLAANHADSEAENNADVAAIIAALVADRSPGRSSSAPQHPPMADMMRQTRAELGRAWSIVDFSALMGLSSSQVYRRFQKVVGSSPMNWLRRERMNAAKRLLVQTNTPISEIALRCGYPDPLHFSREFRRVTGLSPTAFRDSRGN
jgi:AraC-like DNA-binding protein